MAKSNRNRHQKPSQRPATQQVGIRPGAAGEPQMDTRRVPSAATAEQAQEDAAATTEMPPVQPAVTATDPFPGEATDIVDGEGDGEYFADEDVDPEVDGDVEPEDFQGFEDLNQRVRHVNTAQESGPTRVVQAPVRIDRTASEQEEWDRELVPIIPRRTQMRTNINGSWYNLVKGQEQFVPRAVAEHLAEKGVL